MRIVIEQVTCDQCGQVSTFEKYNEGTNTARLESLTEWLARLGWKTSAGGRGDVCPQCKDKPK